MIDKAIIVLGALISLLE
ncbi:damage-inducible type I toxin DinQ, partial [Escherichia coli H21]